MNTIKDDAISRHGALNALCAVCGKGCDKGKFVYNAPQDEQVILCPEHYCLCTLPSAQSEQRWIPCSERLPDHGENVIVSIHDDSGDYACDYASFGWYAVKGKFWVVDNEVNERVVAWLPLPIPYRKGGQE